MKFPASKTIVFFSLLLYLAAANAAALHGFPMSIQNVNQDCHSLSTKLVDNSDSVTCEIFCAVMAQAISIDYVSPLIKTSPELKYFKLIQSHLSFPNQIEPKPPKQIV